MPPFAVDVLKSKHIIAMSHYGCGGIAGAVDYEQCGLVDRSLHPIQRVYVEHRNTLDAIADERMRLNPLCELKVMRQMRNVASDLFVRDARTHGQEPHVHGQVDSPESGLATDLEVTASG